MRNEDASSESLPQQDPSFAINFWPILSSVRWCSMLVLGCRTCVADFIYRCLLLSVDMNLLIMVADDFSTLVLRVCLCRRMDHRSVNNLPFSL